ncbi:hypothetical protein [Saccharopolyspora sp. SCSIO 74807]|uniref:hypothetical protein n=1 Tax=Saccharopolyspora sp. SCSIO 74807 TaxID=3118084 RepID=UPI0030D40778
MSDEEITPRRSQNSAEPSDGGTSPLEAQVEALTEIVGGLTSKLTALRGRIETLENGDPDEPDGAEDEPADRPAPWVLFAPPAAAEDRLHRSDNHTPLWTVQNFVGWYNTTFLGIAGSQARAIPVCWAEHPGLAQEVAVLAYSWRRAHIGTTANVRDAQLWLQQTRPGFAARLAEWVHPHCLDGRHREVGAVYRANRFAAAESEQRSDATPSRKESQ